MRDFTIDGKLQRVFVLAESSERVVYIPVKALSETDYLRLIDIEKANPKDMLSQMEKTTLDNGRNSLAVYDSLIQVLVKDGKSEKAGKRLSKPEELGGKEITTAPAKVEQPQDNTEPKADTPKPQRGRPAAKA